MALTVALILAAVVLAVALVACLSVAARRPVARAYVISMPDGSRPRADVAARLGAAGVQSVFVDAVDGRAVADTSRFDEKYPWRPGPIGCALSHMRLWGALQGPALIMEDDAIPVPAFAEEYRRILEEVGTGNIDIVFLGHCLETQGAPWGGSGVLRRSVLPRCTHAYHVTAQGMQKLQSWASDARLKVPVDEELALMCKSGELSCLSAFPMLARQEWQ